MIAYLILAHYQPEHVARLVRALRFEGAWFFLHIDGKSDLRRFEELIPESQNIVYLRGRERVKVYWCGYSQIRATLNLLRSARASGTAFHRYCLLSGSDFPIRSNAQIADQLRSDAEFLRIDRRLDLTAPSSHIGWVGRTYLFDNRFLNPRTAPSHRLRAVVERLIATLPRRRYDRIPLYHGAQWWALTSGCITHVLEFLERNRDYMAFHRHTRCPEEIFFQSIVKSSPFAAKITDDFETAQSMEAYWQSNVHGCHYIDWNAVGVSLPKVLGPSDLDAMISSGALFARKFEGDGSRALRDQLEGMLAEEDPALSC